MMIQRIILCLAVGAGVAIGGWAATAQQPECRYFKVRANSLNISQEARGDAVIIDMLDKDDTVCVTREQKVGDRDWVYVAQKVVTPNERRPVDGWTNPRQLQQLSATEAAALRGPPPAAAPPAAAAPPPDDVLRFSEPVPFGPFPVNGRSIEELAKGTPQFPPIEGLPDNVWKKDCTACHKWDRQSLCEQGASYAKNPRYALRLSHPYGGFSVALMSWAKTGCQ